VGRNPSGKVSFDKKPRMKVDEITNELIKVLKGGKYKFLHVDYSNGDMVGHTGSLTATIKAVEVLDENLKRLLQATDQVGATMIITADHGNCDQMYEIDKDLISTKSSMGGSMMVKTKHTLSPVPLLLVGKDARKFQLNSNLENPGVGNIAATILTSFTVHQLLFPSHRPRTEAVRQRR
jgi:2,3-bisphosphoglycerate-independent phosphoglycerate mutase